MSARECRAQFLKARVIDFDDVGDPLDSELDALAHPRSGRCAAGGRITELWRTP